MLSGAGLSTESGIPDYRGPSGSARRGTPMTYQTFTRDPVARRRYWARSHLGWRTIGDAAPNDGHRAVARLQQLAVVDGIITQNVDGLHQAGRRARGGRAARQPGPDRLPGLRRQLAPGESQPGAWPRPTRHFAAAATAINPDGDAELDDAELDGFAVVDCTGCGGLLKPDVVYFGETVPPDRVSRSFALVGARPHAAGAGFAR